MFKRLKTADWFPGFGIFMLRSLAWIAIAYLVLLAASLFVKLPANRADFFSLIEVLFGVIITALSVVAAFSIAFNWGTLESSLRKHAEDAQKVGKLLEEQNESIQIMKDANAALREGYFTLHEKINSLIESAKVAEQTYENDLKDYKEYTNYLEATLMEMSTAVKSIPDSLRNISDTLEERVRSIASDVVEQTLKPTEIHEAVHARSDIGSKTSCENERDVERQGSTG